MMRPCTGASRSCVAWFEASPLHSRLTLPPNIVHNTYTVIPAERTLYPMKRFLLAATLFVASFSTAMADEPAKAKQGPYVILAGVGSYDDKAITPRPTADADAKALYDLFTDPKYTDVAKDRAVLLTSTLDEARHGKKATREAILKALHDAVAATGKDDLIILGLFGRGAPVGDQTAFFTVDSTVKERAKTAIVGSDLAAELKPAKGQKILVLTDIHFKGFDAGKETLAEPTLRDLITAVFGGSEDRDEETIANDKLLMLATIPSHDPLVKGDNGLFTATLIDALKGKADVEGYAPDGLITADELTKYVDKELTNQARTLGKTVKEKESIPFMVGEQTSHFPITKNPDVTAAVQKRLKAVAELAKAGTINKNVFAEGELLLSRMPKLKAQQDLRKAYEQLADGKVAAPEFEKTRELIKDGMKLPTAAATEFMKKTYAGIEQMRVKYIKVLNAGEQTANAIRGIYKRLEMPVPEAIDAELKKGKELSVEQQKELLVKARLDLGKREDLDENKDVDMALMMMAYALNDPYSIYLDRETVKKSESQIKSSFSGIGIHIRRDLARDGLLCVSPIKGSPAYKEGLKAGDLITEIRREVDAEGNPINSEADKVVSTKGMKMDDALKLILGKPGVPVTVMVEREGEAKPLSFTIKRGRVSLETVLGVKRDSKDNWEYWIDEENKIGYIYLSQFGPMTAAELDKAIGQMQRLGMKGLVLDLRFNPGGMLSAALMICNMFVEDGLLLSVRPRVGREEKYYDRDLGQQNKYTKFPIAVLVNGSSASASEIVSACLQDYGRGVVIGERSYGKGSVQTIERFDPTGGEFKFTTARYFPPLGRNIDKVSSGGKPEDEWGVKPNDGYEVKITREEKTDLAEWFRDKEVLQKLPSKEKEKADKGPLKDKQLDKAMEYLRKEIGVPVAGAPKK
ncbi:hypothetical protein BH11PLA2_BH11PLA2_40270 [soil metagenome]